MNHVNLLILDACATLSKYFKSTFFEFLSSLFGILGPGFYALESIFFLCSLLFWSLLSSGKFISFEGTEV